jgi:hypothetical protein
MVSLVLANDDVNNKSGCSVSDAPAGRPNLGNVRTMIFWARYDLLREKANRSSIA